METNASSTVSFDSTFCSGHSVGHPAVPFRSSRQATMVLTTPASSAIASTGLRKPYTPSFDVKAVHDSHDYSVYRSILRRRREARRAAGRIEDHFPQSCAHTVHRHDVATLTT